MDNMIDLKTKICLWVITLGLLNFLAYAIGYTVTGGESIHGQVRQYQDGRLEYVLKPDDHKVSRAAFVYIGVHSISIWLGMGAVILATLTLAKDRIADSLQDAAMRGRTLCTVLAVVTALATGGLTFDYLRRFLRSFENPVQVDAKGQPIRANIAPGVRESTPNRERNSAKHSVDRSAIRPAKFAIVFGKSAYLK